MRWRTACLSLFICAYAFTAYTQNPNNEQISPTVSISLSGLTVSSNGTVQYFSNGNGMCSGYHRVFGTDGGVLKDKEFAGVTASSPYNAQIAGDGQPSGCYRATVYAAGFFGTSNSVTSGQVCLPAPPPQPPPNPDPGPGGCIDNCDGGVQNTTGAGSEPLLINLSGPYKLSGLNDPVTFDINATGHAQTIGWTARG
ncbi:MAG: hypothetical protein QOE82_1420, partial [Thermoanaerobaculia bacterium]|nr:hypothetical protein [Thermoanaerobaculia bacterium]